MAAVPGTTGEGREGEGRRREGRGRGLLSVPSVPNLPLHQW